MMAEAFWSDSCQERPDTDRKNHADARQAENAAKIAAEDLGKDILGSARPESGGVFQIETIHGTAAGTSTNGKTHESRANSLHPICGDQKSETTGERSEIAAVAARNAKIAARNAAEAKYPTNEIDIPSLEAPISRRIENVFRLDIQTAFEKKNAAVPARKNTTATACETYSVTSSTIRAAPPAPQRKLRTRAEISESARSDANIRSATDSLGVRIKKEKSALERVEISGNDMAVS
jgi:hypothetical protein